MLILLPKIDKKISVKEMLIFHRGKIEGTMAFKAQHYNIQSSNQANIACLTCFTKYKMNSK